MKNKETAAKSDTKADRFKELGLVEPTVAKDILNRHLFHFGRGKLPKRLNANQPNLGAEYESALQNYLLKP